MTELYRAALGGGTDANGAMAFFVSPINLRVFPWAQQRFRWGICANTCENELLQCRIPR